MRWPGDASDVDDDILEPLLPGSEETLPGFEPMARPARRGRPPQPAGLPVVKARDPKVLRLWLLAAGLGVMSVLQFAAAGYVRGVERDLRDIEAVWRDVLRIDSDRAHADAALVATQREYGNSPGLEEQRDTLYEVEHRHRAARRDAPSPRATQARLPRRAGVVRPGRGVARGR
jgi:hypothetical protein